MNKPEGSTQPFKRTRTRRPVEERFWEKVNKNGPVPAHVPHLGNCWIWTANNRGYYGSFWLRDELFMSSHRFSYELANGPITNGLHCLHKCDNGLCVRPDHLFLGTISDNAKDRCNKGRTPGTAYLLEWCKKHGSELHRGKKCNFTKLTESQVREIRGFAGTATHAEIGKRFGVKQSVVSRIISRTRWAWLKD